MIAIPVRYASMLEVKEGDFMVIDVIPDQRGEASDGKQGLLIKKES